MITKLISLLIALMLLVSCFATVAFAGDVDIDLSQLTKKVYSINELEGKYKVQGRTTVINNLLMLDYSASGMEFNAYCEGNVTVTFSASSISGGNDGGCYFTVIVDGVKQARDFCRITATGETKFVIAKDLKIGNHTFEIYRQTEIERATVGIKEIDIRGSFTAAAKNNDMYIEFIGDSISTAYGNLTQNGSGVTYSAPKYQDATQGYACLTARTLNADWSIVAQQGRGAKYGYTTENLLDIYPKLRYNKDKTTNYDFARQPDYVVIALGTNDINTYSSRFSATLDDVKKGFEEMLALVREKNPNAKIVWAYNMMTSDANNVITSVIEEAGGAENGYYSVKLTKNTAGGNGHPYYTAHQTMATELSKFIKSLEPVTFVPGNVDGDKNGAVDLEDVVVLSQYVADWKGISYVAEALDPDASGTPDLMDVVLLAQYVAKWDVTISDTPYIPID